MCLAVVVARTHPPASHPRFSKNGVTGSHHRGGTDLAGQGRLNCVSRDSISGPRTCYRFCSRSRLCSRRLRTLGHHRPSAVQPMQTLVTITSHRSLASPLPSPSPRNSVRVRTSFFQLRCARSLSVPPMIHAPAQPASGRNLPPCREPSESPFNSVPASQRNTPAQSPKTFGSGPGTPRACSICLSPVQKRRGISKGGVYKTRCCHNVFHQDCLNVTRSSVCVARDGRGAPARVPLCRSMTPTGLTQCAPARARRTRSVGGFVSGWALHGEMSAAPPRRAVPCSARSYARLANSRGSRSRRRHLRAHRATPAAAAAASTAATVAAARAARGGVAGFFSPGGAYASLAPPARQRQQLESRFQVAEQQEQQQAAHAQGDGDMAVDLS